MLKSFAIQIADPSCLTNIATGDPKSIQEIDFTGNLDRAENARINFIIEEEKETIFSKGVIRVLWFYLVLIKY